MKCTDHCVKCFESSDLSLEKCTKSIEKNCNIFECYDSSNKMRTISFMWNDYSAFTSIVNLD